MKNESSRVRRHVKEMGRLAYDNYQGTETCPFKVGNPLREVWIDAWIEQSEKDRPNA